MKWAPLIVVLVGACAGDKTSTKVPTSGSAGGSGSDMATMKPGDAKSGGTFVQGAPLTPAKGLIAWFEEQKRDGQPRLTRVPIVLKKGDVGFSPRGARIGGGADAVEVFVSDSALGVGLTNRARKCTGETCPFLVEGYWRGDEDGAYHYEVRSAGSEPITAAELAAITHAQVEGESGN